jgi:hypothetical protein
MNTAKKLNLEMSLGKKSIIDSDVDGLINWANALPDDIGSNAGDASFVMNSTAMKFL